jgi:predicted dehydrogenase
MRKIRIGVIGCGYWGPKLARNFNELGDAELTWVSDLHSDRLNHMKELYPNITATHDYRQVLSSDVDGVAIATPVYSHHPLAMEALRAGKHVLIEKPIARTVAQAIEIAETADRLGLIAKVGHTFQHNYAVRTMRDLIAKGEIGQVYYINATRVNLGLFQPDINVMWDLAPHDISIMLHILGLDPFEVSARGAVCVQKEKNLHDVAYVTMHFPEGILADLRVSWLDPVKIRRITVVGSKKMMVYDDIKDERLVLYDKGVEIPPYSDTPEEFHMSYRNGPETLVPVKATEPLRVVTGAFINCIKAGAQKCYGCEERVKMTCSQAWVGVRVVQILEAAQESLSNGGGRESVTYSNVTAATFPQEASVK